MRGEEGGEGGKGREGREGEGRGRKKGWEGRGGVEIELGGEGNTKL